MHDVAYDEHYSQVILLRFYKVRVSLNFTATS